MARAQWRRSFRERKRHSSLAFADLLRERGIVAEPVLDCSCGLGLKTIVMREAGLNVQGSDICGLAIEYARLLAAKEGHPDIAFFVSSWADLPRTADRRYAAVFNDALSWTHSDEDMAAGLRGVHGCLRPGGVLVYMGALPGSDRPQQDVLDEEWRRRTARGRHWLGVRAADERRAVQEVVFVEKGTDSVDEHHLYVVHEDGIARVEEWCCRCSVRWAWSRIEPFLRGAGFVSFGVKQSIGANGRPFHLVVAERD
jgi:SAM-dependent methyltransferase